MPASSLRPISSLAVGVTGHRPNRLAAGRRDGLRAECLAILQALRPLAGHGTASIVTSLAEGADRIVADAGLRLGYRLVCPLPFALDDYSRDFATTEGQQDYHRLLAAADRIVPLTGSRGDSAAAYEAAGLWMLDVANVLLALWDGAPSQGRGGTVEIMEEARRRSIAVFWLHATLPRPPTLLSSPAGLEPTLAAVLAAVTSPTMSTSDGR